MEFTIPADIAQLLDDLDTFIDDVIKPIENEDDNIRYFDHRREDSRTDWERDGLPNAEWEALLVRMRSEADKAGFLRWHLPERFGGSDGTNLGMAIIREHLARRGLGLHNDLQNESSIIGNFPTVLMMERYGSPIQQEYWIPKMLEGQARIGFGLTEPLHGSDATWMETTAVRDGDEWVINGEKYWNTGLHHATHDYIFARTSGNPGEGHGITCFIVPTDSPGFKVEEFMWTFNMPTDHAHVRLTDVRVHNDDILGDEGRGLQTAPVVRAREPHPASGVVGGCGSALHRRGGQLREEPDHLRQAASAEPSHPVPTGRALHRGGDDPGAHLQDRLGDGRGRRPHGDHRQGGHVQLPRQPVLLRRR